MCKTERQCDSANILCPLCLEHFFLYLHIPELSVITCYSSVSVMGTTRTWWRICSWILSTQNVQQYSIDFADGKWRHPRSLPSLAVQYKLHLLRCSLETPTLTELVRLVRIPNTMKQNGSRHIESCSSFSCSVMFEESKNQAWTRQHLDNGPGHAFVLAFCSAEDWCKTCASKCLRIAHCIMDKR